MFGLSMQRQGRVPMPKGVVGRLDIPYGLILFTGFHEGVRAMLD
jgi:hypothetical protein